MAHTCPECGQYCTCNGDIDDIDFGDGSEGQINCICWKTCQRNEEFDLNEDFIP